MPSFLYEGKRTPEEIVERIKWGLERVDYTGSSEKPKLHSYKGPHPDEYKPFMRWRESETKKGRVPIPFEHFLKWQDLGRPMCDRDLNSRLDKAYGDKGLATGMKVLNPNHKVRKAEPDIEPSPVSRKKAKQPSPEPPPEPHREPTPEVPKKKSRKPRKQPSPEPQPEPHREPTPERLASPEPEVPKKKSRRPSKQPSPEPTPEPHSEPKSPSPEPEVRKKKSRKPRKQPSP